MAEEMHVGIVIDSNARDLVKEIEAVDTEIKNATTNAQRLEAVLSDLHKVNEKGKHASAIEPLAGSAKELEASLIAAKKYEDKIHDIREEVTDLGEELKSLSNLGGREYDKALESVTDRASKVRSNIKSFNKEAFSGNSRELQGLDRQIDNAIRSASAKHGGLKDYAVSLSRTVDAAVTRIEKETASMINNVVNNRLSILTAKPSASEAIAQRRGPVSGSYQGSFHEQVSGKGIISKGKVPSYSFTKEEIESQKKMNNLVPVIDPATGDVFYILEDKLRNKKGQLTEKAIVDDYKFAGTRPTKIAAHPELVLEHDRETGRVSHQIGAGWETTRGKEEKYEWKSSEVLSATAYKAYLGRGARALAAYKSLNSTDAAAFREGKELSSDVPKVIREALKDTVYAELSEFKKALAVATGSGESYNTDATRFIRSIYDSRFPNGHSADSLFSKYELDDIKSYNDAYKAAEAAQKDAAISSYRNNLSPYVYDIRGKLYDPAESLLRDTMDALSDGASITDTNIQENIDKIIKLVSALSALTGLNFNKFTDTLAFASLSSDPSESIRQAGSLFVNSFGDWDNFIRGQNEKIATDAFVKRASSFGLTDKLDTDFFNTVLETGELPEIKTEMDALRDLYIQQNAELQKRKEYMAEELRLLKEGTDQEKDEVRTRMLMRAEAVKEAGHERYERQEEKNQEARFGTDIGTVLETLPKSVQSLISAMGVSASEFISEVISRVGEERVAFSKKKNVGVIKEIAVGGGEEVTTASRKKGISASDFENTLDTTTLASVINEGAYEYVSKTLRSIDQKALTDYLVQSATEAKLKPDQTSKYVMDTPMADIAQAIVNAIMLKVDNPPERKPKGDYTLTGEALDNFLKKDLYQTFGDDPKSLAVGSVLEEIRADFLRLTVAKKTSDADTYEGTLLAVIDKLESFFSHISPSVATGAVDAKIAKAKEEGDEHELALLLQQKATITTMVTSGKELLHELQYEADQFYDWVIEKKEHSIDGFLDNNHLSETTTHREALSDEERARIQREQPSSLPNLISGLHFIVAELNALEEYEPQAFDRIAGSLYGIENTAPFRKAANRYERPTRPQNLDISDLPIIATSYVPSEEKDSELVRIPGTLEKLNDTLAEFNRIVVNYKPNSFVEALGSAEFEKTQAYNRVRQQQLWVDRRQSYVDQLEANGIADDSEEMLKAKERLTESKERLANLTAAENEMYAAYYKALSAYNEAKERGDEESSLGLLKGFAETSFMPKQVQEEIKRVLPYMLKADTSGFTEAQMKEYNTRIAKRGRDDDDYKDLSDAEIVISVYTDFIRGYFTESQDIVKEALARQAAQSKEDLKATAVVGMKAMLDNMANVLVNGFIGDVRLPDGSLKHTSYTGFLSREEEARRVEDDPTNRVKALASQYAPLINEDSSMRKAYDTLIKTLSVGESEEYKDKWAKEVYKAFDSFTKAVSAYFTTIQDKQREITSIVEQAAEEEKGAEEVLQSTVEEEVPKKKPPRKSSGNKQTGSKPNKKSSTTEDPSVQSAPPVTLVFDPDWAKEATLQETNDYLKNSEQTLKDTKVRLEEFITAVSGKEVNYFKEQAAKAKDRDPFSTKGLKEIEKISGAYPELVQGFSRINAEDVHQMEEQFRKAAEAMGVTVDDLVSKEEAGTHQVTATIHKGTEEAKITVKQAGKETKTIVEDVEKNVKGSSERTIASLQSIISMLSPLLKGLGVKQLISAAGAAEKALKSLQATTGKYAKEALTMIDTLNEAYGMSKTQAAQALTYAYNQISEVGISNNQALQMSDALVQLGADYSAYYGGAKSAMEVTQALTQVMLGSYRAARQYGIAISSTDIEQLAIAYGKQANNLSEAEKMLYRYQVVMSRASNVMGEYERTSGTYFNAQQELNKAWADAKVALGDNLLPYATSVLTIITDLADSLGSGGLSGSLLVAIVTLTSAASAFLKLTKSVEGLAKTLGTTSLAMGGWISIALAVLAGVVLLTSSMEKKAEEERKAAAAAYAHADAIEAVAEATQNYTASLGTNEEALRKYQLSTVVSTLGTAYKENQAKIKEARADSLVYDLATGAAGGFNIGSQKSLDKDIEQYTKQSDAALSAMLSAANGLLPYTKDIDTTIEAIVSMTDLEGDELTAVKEYLKENLSIYDAIAANAKAVVDYSSKLETAEKNLVSLAQKRLESRNELYEAYKIELQYLDEVYNKELDIAKEAASNTLTVNMESAITNAKHALDTAKGDDDTEALADRLEQLQNADLNEIEVFVTDEMNDSEFKGTEEQLGAIRKQLMDMYGFEETEAALIVGAYKSMTDRQKLYLKESEKLLLDYIDKQDVVENELKKNELETIGGDIYQSMDARRNAYSDLLELQNDEVNTAYVNQVALIKKALADNIINQEEYNAYMDRAERKRLRDSKANFDSYINNIKNATDEIADTRRTLLSERATNIGDFQSVYDLAIEGADVTYQNAMVTKADYLRSEINSLLEQLSTAEGEEKAQLLTRYGTAYKELISLTGETAEEQAIYNERMQQAKDNAYLEYIQACSAAFKEYATNIANAKTPLEEFTEATRTLAEHAVDQTSDPTGAITAYRNTRQAIWDAQSNIDTLREASASAISRFEKEDKYRGKIDFKRLADANASGALADMNIKKFLTVPKGEVDTEEMEAFLKEYADKTKDIARNEFADVADAIAEGLTQGLSAIDELLSMNAENEQTQIQNRISALKKAYDDMKEQMEKRNDQSYDNLTRSQKDAIERQKKMDEDELERQQALIEEQEAMLEEAKRKEFERQKAFNIAEATIAGIKGAIDAYTSMASIPYVGTALGIAAAAAVTAFTAAKINAIASQEYQASYAQGAYNLPQDQTAQVHKGEMIIPRPFAQELRDEVSGNSSYSSSDEITINVYGATDDVSVESNTVEGNQQLDIYLTQRVKTMVARGELDNALQTRYSISKNGRRS